MTIINGLKVTNNNSSKAKGNGRSQAPTIRVARDGILLCRVEVSPDVRSSDPLGFISRKHFVCSHAMEKRKEFIDKLTAVGIDQDTIEKILQLKLK